MLTSPQYHQDKTKLPTTNCFRGKDVGYRIKSLGIEIPDFKFGSITSKSGFIEQSSPKTTAAIFLPPIYHIKEDDNVVTSNSSDYYQSSQNNDLSQNFLRTLERISELKDPEETEEGCELPTKKVFSRVENFLGNLYKILNKSFPIAYAVNDGRQGIDIVWRFKASNQQLRINFSSSGSSDRENLVYHRWGDKSKMLRNLSPREIASVLRKIITSC